MIAYTLHISGGDPGSPWHHYWPIRCHCLYVVGLQAVLVISVLRHPDMAHSLAVELVIYRSDQSWLFQAKMTTAFWAESECEEVLLAFASCSIASKKLARDPHLTNAHRRSL